MGSKILVPALLALLVGGCPKRQTTPRVVYVQAPPPAAGSTSDQATNASGEALTIQEPPLPPAAIEPATVPVTASTQSPTQTDKIQKRTVRPQSHDSEGTPPAEVSQPLATPEAPRLEPVSGSAGQEDATQKLEARLNKMDSDLSTLEKQSLTDAQRRTLQDAGGFRAQAVDALHNHDLLRANQLSDKAEQLIEAVQHH